jgi:hypothetical protein
MTSCTFGGVQESSSFVVSGFIHGLVILTYHNIIYTIPTIPTLLYLLIPILLRYASTGA